MYRVGALRNWHCEVAVRQKYVEQIHSVNSAEDNPLCVIYSNHPLALCSIKDAVCSDARLRPGLTPCYSKDSKLLHGAKEQILILDTCSVENWAVCLEKWRSEGGPVIALVSPELLNGDLELQILYLGATGVLTFADMPGQLPQAIYAAAEGRLWFRRDVLHAYIKQTSAVLRRSSPTTRKLTTRETQILNLLQQDLPNRLIAQRLAISERTIKFHVSNILHKLNVGRRGELRVVNFPNSLSATLSFHRPSAVESKGGQVPRLQELLNHFE